MGVDGADDGRGIGFVIPDQDLAGVIGGEEELVGRLKRQGADPALVSGQIGLLGSSEFQRTTRLS